MAKLNFTDTGIEIDLEGIEKFLTIKSKLSIPYNHIVNVEENAENVKAYLRVGGTALGHRHYDYGRFITNEGKGFYVMKDKNKAFAIHLKNDAYSVIVLELEDNFTAIKEINKRLEGKNKHGKSKT